MGRPRRGKEKRDYSSSRRLTRHHQTGMAQEINKRTWSEVVKRASCFLSKSVSRPNAKIILRFSPSVPMSEIFFAHAYLIFPPQTLFGTVRRALRCVTDYPPLLALLGILSAKEEVGRGGERRGRGTQSGWRRTGFFFQVRPPPPHLAVCAALFDSPFHPHVRNFFFAHIKKPRWWPRRTSHRRRPNRPEIYQGNEKNQRCHIYFAYQCDIMYFFKKE